MKITTAISSTGPSTAALLTVLYPQVRSYKLAHEFDHPDSVSYTVEAADPERVHIVTSTESDVQLPGLQVTAQSSDSDRQVTLRSGDSRKKVALASDSAPTQIDGLRLRVLHTPQAEGLSGVKVRAGDRQAIIEKIASHYHAKRRKTRRRRRKHFKRKRQFRRRGAREEAARRRRRPVASPSD